VKQIYHKRGALAEALACRFLKKQGLVLLQRNFNTKMGEIDLIMRDKDVVVFVEVKHRTNRDFIKPAQTINRLKRQRLIRTALFYLQTVKKHKPFKARFDMIGVAGNEEVEWIKNIFMM
jgi:putative endonuclease